MSICSYLFADVPEIHLEKIEKQYPFYRFCSIWERYGVFSITLKSTVVENEIQDYALRVMNLFLSYIGEQKLSSIDFASNENFNFEINAVAIISNSEKGSLELFQKGSWKPVFLPKNSLIFLAGDQLEHITCGGFLSVLHRFRGPPPVIFRATLPSTFSLYPRYRSIMQQLQIMPDALDIINYLSYYPNVTVEQARRSRLIEFGCEKNPTEKEVYDLRKAGLLRQAPIAIKNQFPYFFKSDL